MGKLFSKELVFYAIAGTIIAFITERAGANLPVILFSSLLIPPLILLAIRIIR